ncbi:MAG: redoxin domain-containing protein [Phycisphaerae bacterium]|jgi:hypothetical protein
MKYMLIPVLCMGILLPTVARADLEKGTYAPDLEAKEWMNTKELLGSEEDGPLSLSDLRGMVVVLYFWVSWSRGGEYYMPLVNIVENHPYLGRRQGVFLMGVTEADRSRVEEMVKEERLLFPIALECDAAEEYDIDSFPHVVVIDPNGKIAFSGSATTGGGDRFIQQIIDAVRETPPTRTHPREAAEARRHLDHAREQIRGGDYRAAYRSAQDAYERALTGDTLKTECQDMLDLLEAIGRDKLAEALADIDFKKFEDGVTLLREVSGKFRGMKSARTANQRLRSLEENFPEVKQVLERLQHEAEARGLLVAVRDALWDRDFGTAYDTLEQITKDYADTPVAVDARTIMQRMGKNQTIMGYVRDHKAAKDCNNWMGQARSFIRIGNVPKAKELLRRIINEHPDTKYEEEAYRMLGELP